MMRGGHRGGVKLDQIRDFIVRENAALACIGAANAAFTAFSKCPLHLSLHFRLREI